MWYLWIYEKFDHQTTLIVRVVFLLLVITTNNLTVSRGRSDRKSQAHIPFSSKKKIQDVIGDLAWFRSDFESVSRWFQLSVNPSSWR